jgi:hypothetical protein
MQPKSAHFQANLASAASGFLILLAARLLRASVLGLL